MSKAAYGVSDRKVDVLSCLRRVAHASSAAKYEDLVKPLMASSVLSSESKAAMLVSKAMVDSL